MTIDGYKTYLVAAGMAVFAGVICWNDYQQFGAIKDDTIRYIGGFLSAAAGMATVRSAMKKVENK